MYTIESAQTVLTRLLEHELSPGRYSRLWDIFLCAAIEDALEAMDAYGAKLRAHLERHPDLMRRQDVQRAARAATDIALLEDAIDAQLMAWYARHLESEERFLAEHPGISVARVLDVLVRRHERFVYRSACSYTRRYGLSEEDAWDLTGQVFEAVISHPERYKYASGATFRAWLGAIVRNKSVDLVRGRSRRRALAEELEDVIPALEDVVVASWEDAFMASDVAGLVRRRYHESLEQLARTAFRRYQAWILCVEQDLTSQQAANIMGCSAPTVRRASSEARRYLKSSIEALCLEHNLELREVLGRLQPADKEHAPRGSS